MRTLQLNNLQSFESKQPKSDPKQSLLFCACLYKTHFVWGTHQVAQLASASPRW